MGLSRTSDPAAPPVSVTEAKNESRIVISNDDTMIARHIEAITGYAETFQNRAFVTQTWEWTLDFFPALPFDVPKPPLQSITSIQYVDTDGNPATWASSNYDVDTASQPGRVALSHLGATPTDHRTGIINSVTIKFVAGYGAAAAVPQEIKQGIIAGVVDLFEHPEGQPEFPLNKNPLIDKLLWSKRFVGIG